MQAPHPEAHSADEPEFQSAALRTLQKILASDGFAKSERMRRFLTYAVERSLAQDFAQLKESVIGVEVFDRPVGYDPKADPIVRIEARRLREKLSAYYEREGKDDEIVIALPKGGYVTSIDFRASRKRVRSVKTDPGIGIPTPENHSGINEKEETLSDVSSPSPSSNFPDAPDRLNGRRFALRWFALSAAACLLVGVAVWKFVPFRHAASPIEVRNFTSLPGAESQPAFSPDGSKVVFRWNGADGNHTNLYVQGVDRFSPVLLTKDAEGDVSTPAWSPNGHDIAFLRPVGVNRLGVFLLDVVTRHVSQRAEIESEPSPIGPDVLLDWSPDGNFIAATHRHNLVLISPDTGTMKQITSSSNRVLGHYEPAFSPDGKTIAFREAISYGVDALCLLDLATGRITPLYSGPDRVFGHTWAADGKSIIFGRRRSLWRIAITGGEPQRLTDGTVPAVSPRIARTGNRLVFASPRAPIRIWRIPLNGGKAEQVLSSTVTDVSPDISPDGQRIAFRSDRKGNDEIWLAGIHGTAPQRITYLGQYLTGCPRWSPDGRYLAFDSRFDKEADIFVVDTQTGKLRRLENGALDEVVPSWSHDGHYLYYTVNTGGSWQIWKRPAAGADAPVQITRQGGFGAWESHDGRYLYYNKSRGGTAIWRVPVNGGTEEPVFEHLESGMWGNWRIYNDTIVYATAKAPYELRSLNLTTRRDTHLADLPRRPVVGDTGLAIAPDGSAAYVSLLDPVDSDLFIVDPFA